ncbi:DegV domain-containing protein lin2658 [Acididesulfobacillus acetoxydans]|uniref:DegV domain-containing protein lin2658 n=1 Tax=Acididesulfobacillus acetoxydans TaxID=1561005 RepID=A0ABP1XD33_9FIRM|nr:DegV family protein [Acididesulfobacillus acetoxydans]CEJ06856.1 DegV domain-containing protein lin2658 [Acididesulfobacillus acetoxydans]
MRKTAVVMDSTGYLTQDILDRFHIRVVPLKVTVGEETFTETEIGTLDFLGKLRQISGFPTTSQPSVGDFLTVYEDLFAAGAESIVSLHLSEGLSGTVVAARMARDLASKHDVHVVDSGTGALAFGLLAWAAAEWAEAGVPVRRIVEHLEDLKTQTRLYFILETLENLRRGGRIGGGAAVVGTLLQIKPILCVNNKGQIDVFAKVRSRAKAWGRVKDELAKDLAGGRPHRICVQHVGSPDLGEKTASELRREYPQQDIRVFGAGPVIAAHVGQGALGLAYLPWP